MEEEDKVKEIEREELRPKAVCILRKRDDEVVVVEEDTTMEVKRLRSTLSMAMKQIEVSAASAVSVFGVEDYVPLQSWCFAGHCANCCTTTAVDQEDGAPRRGEQEAKGGGETDGEKHPEGPA